VCSNDVHCCEHCYSAGVCNHANASTSTAVLIKVVTLAQPSNKAYHCSEHVNSVMLQHTNIVFTDSSANA
jgi:hypothetical protein